MTITWKLIQWNGDVITLPGYMKTGHEVWFDNKYISSLNYTLSTDDSQLMLRCIVRVDDEIRGRYEAKDEAHIPSCGKVTE